MFEETFLVRITAPDGYSFLANRQGEKIYQLDTGLFLGYVSAYHTCGCLIELC